MNPKIKKLVSEAHGQAGRLFPSMKTDAIRRINRHPKLSNALRNAAGIGPIDQPGEEEPIGVVKAVGQDVSRIAKGAVVTGAKRVVNVPWVRADILPLLDRTPKFRAWLKRAVFAPPEDSVQESCVAAVLDLSRQGLIAYGALSALEQRGREEH